MVVPSPAASDNLALCHLCPSVHLGPGSARHNHIRGQALANALELKRMLTGQRLNVPQTLTRHFPELAGGADGSMREREKTMASENSQQSFGEILKRGFALIIP